MTTRNDKLEETRVALTNITVAKGFSASVHDVFRKRVWWDSVQTFPVLMVLGGPETYEDDLGDYTHAIMNVKIVGLTRDRADPEIEVNNVIGDVRKCLESETYNPNKKHMQIASLNTDEGWIHDEQPGICMFEYTVKLRYRFLRSNP